MIRFFSWENNSLTECVWSESTARRLVRISLSTLRERYEVTGWDLLRPDDALANLDELGTTVVFVGDLCVAMNIDQPWFSKEPVLYEEFVDDGVPLGTVVSILEHAAKVVGIKRILVGTRAAPNQRHAGLAKLYTQEGMAVSTVELMKVVQ